MSLTARFDRVRKQQQEQGMEEFMLLSMDEMEQCKVNFGQAQKGKSYKEVWDTDRSWRRFIINKYGESPVVEHKKIIYFFQLKIERLELEMNLPDVEPEQMVMLPKAKAKAKAQTTNPNIETASMVSEPWDLMAENETQAVAQGLQDRMYQVENVMQEVLNHLRQHANP